MPKSNRNHNRGRTPRTSRAGAVGQAASAKKNRQNEIRDRIVEALLLAGIPCSQWPDCVQVHYLGIRDRHRFRQFRSPSPFQPPAFDRLNQSPEEWALMADKAWEQHRDRFLQECEYWVKAGVDQEIPQAKRLRDRGTVAALPSSRKRGANTPLDQRYGWTAKYFARVPLKEIAGEHANPSTVGRVARRIIRDAGWSTRSKEPGVHFNQPYQEFPKWKYHATESARIVHSRAEEAALGDGWMNSPAELQAIYPGLRPEEAILPNTLARKRQ